MATPDPTDRDPARPSWADDAHLDSVGLVARLLRIHLLVGRLVDEVTAAEGISDGDYLVLGLIERSPGQGGSPARIAEVLGRSTGGMTLTLDRLEAMGWITRVPDPADRRRVVLGLSPAGLDAVGRVRDALREWEGGLALDAAELREAFGMADALLELFARRGAVDRG